MLLEVTVWHQTRHNINFAVRFGLHLSILIYHHFGSPITHVIYLTQLLRCSVVKKSKGNFMDTTGKCDPKWVLMAGIHLYCSLVIVTMNNDIKLLTNSSETSGSSWYITGYVTIKQNRHHNLSGIMTKGYTCHIENLAYLYDIHEQQQLLIFCLVNVINCEQELAEPMVCSHFAGWGEKFCSHKYSPIYWSSFVGILLHHFPALKNSQQQ